MREREREREREINQSLQSLTFLFGIMNSFYKLDELYIVNARYFSISENFQTRKLTDRQANIQRDRQTYSQCKERGSSVSKEAGESIQEIVNDNSYIQNVSVALIRETKI